MMNLGYTGKPYDTATGLYNYGFRDYKPAAARFTTVDPVRDGNNWFAYVNNDPVNYIDLWGLFPDAIWDAMSLATGVWSLKNNITKGDVLGIIVDSIGIIADTIALATPIIPGGAGIAIKTTRAAKIVDNVAQTTYGVLIAVEGVQTGNVGDVVSGVSRVVASAIDMGADAAFKEARFADMAARNAASTSAIASWAKTEEVYNIVGNSLSATNALIDASSILKDGFQVNNSQTQTSAPSEPKGNKNK